MSDETFKDWVPAGEDTGAIGDGGFQDFVPTKEPVKHESVEVPVQEVPAPQAPVQPVVEKPYIVPPLDSVKEEENGSQASL